VTRRETIIVAFSLAVTALAIVIVVGHVSIQVAPPNHLPALNGTPPPKPTPGSPGAPAPSPAPSSSAPRMQAVRTQLSATGGPKGSGQCRPSTSNAGSSSSGSTAQNQLLPGVGLPIVLPPAPPLPVSTP